MKSRNINIGDIVKFKYYSNDRSYVYGEVIRIIKILGSVSDITDDIEFEVDPLNRRDLECRYIKEENIEKVYRVIDVKKEKEI